MKSPLKPATPMPPVFHKGYHRRLSIGSSTHGSLFHASCSILHPFLEPAISCGLTESFALWGKFFRPGLRNPSLVAGGCHSIIPVSNAVRCPAKARRLTVDIPVIYSVRYEY
jgi:hypothetical protein